MFKLCGGSGRMLLGRSGRIALGFRYEYGLLSILLPAHWTRRVCPTMFRFKKAYCGIESEPIAIWRMCSESLQMNLVEHDVDVKMLLVIVRDDHELVAFISERLQCVQRAIYPLLPSRPLTRRPCQFIMADSILATIIERCNPLHLYRRCVEAEKILRHDHISAQKKFSGVGVTLTRKVFLKPFEAAGVLSSWLHFGNHAHFTVPVLSALIAL